METTFVEWLQGELNQRGWSQADLARRSHVTQTHISRIMSEMRRPGPDALMNIAHALRVPPDEAFRRAGLLPPRGATAADLARYNDMLDTIASLTPENQALVFSLVEKIRLSEENSRG